MKKIIALLLIVAMLLAFSGCDTIEGILEGTASYDSSRAEGRDSSQTDSSDNTEDTSSKNLPPAIYSVDELGKYLNTCKDEDKLKVSFFYKGEDEFTAEMIARMISASYINYTNLGDLYTITITEYPGDHIVDAYFKKDDSALNADEKKAMEKAIEMVSTAKSKAADDFELELLIYDMLAEHITYFHEEDYYDDPDNPPRNFTVIGALLDGKANCQGYTDAFYTLASIAGFTVSRMNVETKDDFHCLNTILLNGSWYVVDVTFDDNEDGGPTMYYLFNAGLDQINEYTWESWEEIHPIAKYSGNDSYYKRNNIVFDNEQAFAEHIKNEWLKGNKAPRGMVKNRSDNDIVEKALQAALDAENKAYSYTLWFYNDSKHLYYTVEFE